jgi:hypothetical protein
LKWKGSHENIRAKPKADAWTTIALTDDRTLVKAALYALRTVTFDLNGLTHTLPGLQARCGTFLLPLLQARCGAFLLALLAALNPINLGLLALGSLLLALLAAL